MNILIIEDESKTAKSLMEILHEIDDTINIIGVIDSIEQGVEWFNKNSVLPELIFSDIELADGVSFELLKKVKVDCPIIFCTAYNQYMVEAFETNAVSYILKPFNQEQIEKALGKYYEMKKVFSKQTIPNYINVEEILKLFNSSKKPYKSTLIINQGGRILPVRVDEVAYIYATNRQMQIMTTNNKEFSYSSTLDKIAEQLNPDDFFYANRQFIIARNSIQSIERYFNRKLVVKLNLKTPEQIIVSRLKVKGFLEWMEQ